MIVLACVNVLAALVHWSADDGPTKSCAGTVVMISTLLLLWMVWS